MSIDSDVFEELQKDATLARRTLGELAQSINKNEIELGELSNQNKTLSYSYKDAECETSYSSVAELEKLAKEEFSDEITEEELEIELAKCANNFATMIVYQYEISDSSIFFTDYFYGTLPTTVNFSTSDRKVMMREGEGIWLWSEGSTGNGDGYLCIAPVYSDGTFTGKLSYNNEIIGSVEGTYTTSGKGTSDCTITLTFTKLPESVTGFTTGTEYVLTNGPTTTGTGSTEQQPSRSLTIFPRHLS